MNFGRSLKRRKMKEEWKAFKKEHRQFRNMPFAEFRKLWEAGLFGGKNELADEFTEEQELELADMLSDDFEEVVEDEDQEAE